LVGRRGGWRERAHPLVPLPLRPPVANPFPRCGLRRRMSSSSSSSPPPCLHHLSHFFIPYPNPNPSPHPSHSSIFCSSTLNSNSNLNNSPTLLLTPLPPCSLPPRAFLACPRRRGRQRPRRSEGRWRRCCGVWWSSSPWVVVAVEKSVWEEEEEEDGEGVVQGLSRCLHVLVLPPPTRKQTMGRQHPYAACQGTCSLRAVPLGCTTPS